MFSSILGDSLLGDVMDVLMYTRDSLLGEVMDVLIYTRGWLAW